MIKLAIVGCGNIADYFHLPAWLKIKKVNPVALSKVNGIGYRDFDSVKLKQDLSNDIEIFGAINELINEPNIEANDKPRTGRDRSVIL